MSYGHRGIVSTSRSFWKRGVAAGLIALLVACTPGAESHTIKGDLYYSGEPSTTTGIDKCIGQSTTPDYGIQSGTEVLVVDGSGSTVGKGLLVEASDSGTGGTAETRGDLPFHVCDPGCEESGLLQDLDWQPRWSNLLIQ